MAATLFLIVQVLVHLELPAAGRQQPGLGPVFQHLAGGGGVVGHPQGEAHPVLRRPGGSTTTLDLGGKAPLR